MRHTIRLFVLAISVFLIKPSFSAETDNKKWATSIATNGVYLRKPISNDSAIFLGARYYFYNSDFGSSDSTHHSIGLTIGYRLYLKNTEIRKFFESSLSYSRFTNQDSSDYSNTSISFAYGLEKFISPDFSVEGSAGIGFQYSDQDTYNSRTITIPAVKLAINYYF